MAYYFVTVLYDCIPDLCNDAGGWYSWLRVSREGAHHNGARNAEHCEIVYNKQGCEAGMGWHSGEGRWFVYWLTIWGFIPGHFPMFQVCFFHTKFKEMSLIVFSGDRLLYWQDLFSFNNKHVACWHTTSIMAHLIAAICFGCTKQSSSLFVLDTYGLMIAALCCQNM